VSVVPVEPRRRTRRSFWLKVLVAGLLIFAAAGWLRLEQSLAEWNFLGEVGLRPGPLYLALTGGLTGAGGLIAGVGVWLRKRWAFAFTRVFMVAWQAWSWIDRLWLARVKTARVSWPFALAATLLVLLFVFAVLSEEERSLYEPVRARDRG
jgi:hypothetical protein